MNLEYTIFIFIFFELIIVSYIDVKKNKISNWWSVFHILLFFLLVLSSQISLTSSLLYLPIGTLIFGFLFFLLKIMGAGDSKYIATITLLIPENIHLLFLESLIYSTTLVGSMLIILKVFKEYKKINAFIISRYWIALRDIIKSEFSYAPVILLAWIMTCFRIFKN